MLSVMLVLGILVAAALPAMTSSLDDAMLTQATNEILDAFSYARTTARATGANCRVMFTVSTETVRVERMQHNNLSTLLNPATTQLAESQIESTMAYTLAAKPQDPGTGYTFNMASGSWISNVKLHSSNFGGQTFVTFNSYGQPTNDGEVQLKIGSRTRRIQLNTAGTIEIDD